MKLKRFAAFLSVLCMLPFTGCDSNLMSVDGAMQPPRLTEQQNAIYEALKAQVGSNIQLKYPQAGDYRSAFVIKNIDNEPTNEAIVFYQIGLQANAGAQVRVNVLDQTPDGTWVSMCDIAGGGGDIDRVAFGSFGSGDAVNLVIGYRSGVKDRKAFTIYRYADGMLRAADTRDYRAFSLLRTPDTPLDQLIYVADEGGGKKMARLLTFQDGAFRVADETAMYGTVEEYVNLVSGYIPGTAPTGQPALFIDGRIGSELCTEILTIYDDKLYNCTSKTEIVRKTFREQTLYSTDIDRNRFYKVPRLVLMPGYNNSNGLTYTEWMSYENGDFTVQQTTYINSSDGYRLRVPTKWKTDVTATVGGDQNEVKFFRFTGDLNTEGEELLRIRTVQKADSPQKNVDGYFKIASIGQITYLAKINPDADAEYRLSRDDVLHLFSTLL